MKETLKHKEIFEQYYVVGNDRSLAKLRGEMMSPEGVSDVPSLKTLKRWSKAFGWQKRIEERDKVIARKLEAKVDREIVRSKANYRTLVNKVVAKFEAKLKAGKIKINQPQDLDIMAKLDLLLQDGAPEDVTITVNFPETEDEAEERLFIEISSLVERRMMGERQEEFIDSDGQDNRNQAQRLADRLIAFQEKENQEK